MSDEFYLKRGIRRPNVSHIKRLTRPIALDQDWRGCLFMILTKWGTEKRGDIRVWCELFFYPNPYHTNLKNFRNAYRYLKLELARIESL